MRSKQITLAILTAIFGLAGLALLAGCASTPKVYSETVGAGVTYDPATGDTGGTIQSTTVFDK